MANIASARTWFPGVREGVYLDTANFGLLASPVVDAISEQTRELTTIPKKGADHRWFALETASASARLAVGRLIGAQTPRIALVESTSHGLQIAAASIPLAAGDEVLIADWDFVGLSLVWRSAVEQKGISVRTVDLGQSSDPTASLVSVLRPETRVVCTSSVSENHGFRLNLAELGTACQTSGCWLVLDVMQEAGARQLKLERTAVDFASAGGHKWLGCPFGSGFLYVGENRFDELIAPTVGYLGIEEPLEGWGDYLSSPLAGPLDKLPRRRHGQALEIGGTPNFPGRLALATSCGLMNQVGIEAIEQHVLSLSGLLWDELSDLGLKMVTPREDQSRAGIVTFSLGQHERDRDLAKNLASRGVHVSCRYRQSIGGVRLSVHFYNNRQDIEDFLNALADAS